MTQPLICVKNLQTTFFTKAGALPAVDRVSFAIEKGQTLGVVGESGCGKSVVAYSLMGLVSKPGKVIGGQAFIADCDLLTCTDREMEPIRGKKMAMIFQEPMTALNPVLTIGFQIDEQVLRHLNLSRQAAKDRSIDMLARVGIPAPSQRYHDYPHQLSGGMRQRAMIAMALSCEPAFLIADEPTTALDVTIQAQILELIQDLQDTYKMTVKLITHDLSVVSEVADQILVMYAGRTCEYGVAKDILATPAHPYTKALLESIPKIGRRVPRLPTIEGTVPSLLDIPFGCPFQNRCKYVSDQCINERPEMRSISSTQSVACFHPIGT